MKLKLPQFDTEKELHKYIVENEKDLHYQKKQELKHADGFATITAPLIELGKQVIKSEELLEKSSLDVVAIINTTNLLDSHGDVHIKGLWEKSIAENKLIKHTQEHRMTFDKIISDKEDLKVYTKEFTWKELGYDAEGKTQALVFESKVKKNRNGFMFKQYAEGHVDNHSVGMRYVKIATCIRDEDYPEQFENWEKYAPLVANKADLEKTSYFWAVLEAKAIEGSAVPLGSNFVTPTQSVKGHPTSSDEEEIVESKEMLAIKSWLQGE